MVMQSLRTRASGGIGKFILFGLLGMAVAGLALSDVRGVLGGGVASTDVAKVEDETISIQDFDRTVQRSLAQYQQYGITRQQAYKLGIIDEILTGEVRKTFMVKEAKNLGIEIGREQLKKRLAQLIAPQTTGGESPQEALDNLLKLQGFTEAQFIEQVKKEMSVEILSGALKAGFVPNTEQIAQDLFLFQNQSRDIELIIFPNTDISETEPPTDDQLKRLYEGVKHAQYKIPETRSVRFALLNPADIEVDVTLTQEELKKVYNENKDNFLVGEQFVITQVLTQDESKAQEVFDLVQSGKSLKDAGKEVLGDDLKYIEEIPFEVVAMLPVMRDALSEREIGVVKPPVTSPLGVHVMQLDEVIPASIKPFDVVKTDIERELKAEKSAEDIYGIVTDFEDRINNGDDFETVKKDLPLKIGTLENIDRMANNWPETIINPRDTQNALEAIFAIENEQTFSVLEELPSGNFAMFEIQSKTPETFKPFNEVKAELEKQFIADQQAADNRLRVNKFLAEIETGGSTMQTLSKENQKEITRIENITISSPIAPPLNEDARPVIFRTDLNGHAILKLTDSYGIMRLASFKIPTLDMAEEGQIKAIQEELDREAQDEAILMYLRYLGEKYEAKINKVLLERAYGSTGE